MDSGGKACRVLSLSRKHIYKLAKKGRMRVTAHRRDIASIRTRQRHGSNPRLFSSFDLQSRAILIVVIQRT